MSKVQKTLREIKRRKAIKHAKRGDIEAMKFEGVEGPLDTQHLLITALLPPAVKLFLEQCEEEVTRLCGDRYKHGKINCRHGEQNGSIILANQRVGLAVPRVRSKDGQEIPLQAYQEFQNPKPFEQSVFVEGLKRVSQRDYEQGLPKIASSFGFKKSSVSRKWIAATAKKLAALQERSLVELDIRAVFIDGKRFRKHGVIIALGVSGDGRKYVLGIYQADTENHESCLDLLGDLERRGLPEAGLLFVVDGGSGLNKALELKYACNDKSRRRAVRVRCHVHKWRNLEAALGQEAHKAQGLFWALRDAESMAEAKQLSEKLESVLKQLNVSALTSYLEAKADLLAIHELKLSQGLKKFFSTTNPIESLNSMIEEDMRRVKRWQSSEHFQRWLATYCLASEKRMRRVRGYSSLSGLWVRLRTITSSQNKQIDTENIAA